MEKLTIIFFLCASMASAQVVTIDSISLAPRIERLPYIVDGITGIQLSYNPKQAEFDAVAPALLLLEIYMKELRKENVICIDCPEPQQRKIQPSLEDLYEWQKEYFKEQYK